MGRRAEIKRANAKEKDRDHHPNNHHINHHHHSRHGEPEPHTGCPIPDPVVCKVPVPEGEEGRRFTCTNNVCPYSKQLVHDKCFDEYEDHLVKVLSNSGSARGWTDNQRRQNLWEKKGQALVGKVCRCRCGLGLVLRDEAHDVLREKREKLLEEQLNAVQKCKKKKKENALPRLNHAIKGQTLFPEPKERKRRDRNYSDAESDSSYASESSPYLYTRRESQDVPATPAAPEPSIWATPVTRERNQSSRLFSESCYESGSEAAFEEALQRKYEPAPPPAPLKKSFAAAACRRGANGKKTPTSRTSPIFPSPPPSQPKTRPPSAPHSPKSRPDSAAASRRFVAASLNTLAGGIDRTDNTKGLSPCSTPTPTPTAASMPPEQFTKLLGDKLEQYSAQVAMSQWELTSTQQPSSTLPPLPPLAPLPPLLPPTITQAPPPKSTAPARSAVPKSPAKSYRVQLHGDPDEVDSWEEYVHECETSVNSSGINYETPLVSPMLPPLAAPKVTGPFTVLPKIATPPPQKDQQLAAFPMASLQKPAAPMIQLDDYRPFGCGTPPGFNSLPKKTTEYVPRAVKQSPVTNVFPPGLSHPPVVSLSMPEPPKDDIYSQVLAMPWPTPSGPSPGIEFQPIFPPTRSELLSDWPKFLPDIHRPHFNFSETAADARSRIDVPNLYMPEPTVEPRATAPPPIKPLGKLLTAQPYQLFSGPSLLIGETLMANRNLPNKF